MSALSLILEAFDPVADRHIADLGCGAGALSKALVEHGARVTGIDPNAAALAAARNRVPSATFLTGSADAVPLPAGSVDGVVFLNSLHHVPDPGAALHEAARIARPGAPVVVVEPLARGSFFEVLRLVEDETAVRAEAQAALARAIEQRTFVCTRELVFERVETFDALEPFLARVVAVDPERAQSVEANRDAIARAFAQAGERDARGNHLLRQPLQLHVLTPAPPPSA